MVTERIHKIWSRELALDKLSDDDDFFAVGGHSLIMARIQAAIEDEFGVAVPMDVLMRRSTVTQISELLQGDAATVK
jgi:acyl carrier protein